MIDRNIDKVIENHYANNKSALLLTGARQVGKTIAFRRYVHADIHDDVRTEEARGRRDEICAGYERVEVKDGFSRFAVKENAAA